MELTKVFMIGCIVLGVQTMAHATRSYEKLCSGYEKACENGKCGLFENGHHHPMIYRDIQCLKNTDAILVSIQPNKWRVYNTQTETASTFQYDEVQSLNLFLLKTKANNKWGVVSSDGTELLPVKYEDIAILASDYLMAKSNGKWKLFYLQGREMKEISPAAYDDIEPAKGYYKGYYMVTVNGKKGMIYLPTTWQAEKANFSYVKPLFDEIVLPPTYDFVKVSQNKKWGFYDLAAGKLATHLYDNISKLGSFHADVFKISLQGKQGVLMRNNTTKTLEEKLSPSFDDVKALTGKRLIAVSEKGKWGVYDTNQQKLVLDPVYEDVRAQGANAVQVLEQGQWVKKTALK